MKVSYSPRSRRDLLRIGDYIAKKSGSREVANRFLSRLLDSCDELAILPERYPPYRHAAAWRMMPFENYLIFFQVHGESVRIGHIRHAARKPFRKG